MSVSHMAAAQAERRAAGAGAANEAQAAVVMALAYTPFGDWNDFSRAADAGGANRRAALQAESMSRFRDVW